jgi:hypothetical protein
MPSVFVKAIIDHPGKSIQIQLVQLIIQEFGRFQGIQLGRTLLLNQSDTVETMTA